MQVLGQRKLEGRLAQGGNAQWSRDGSETCIGPLSCGTPFTYFCELFSWFLLFERGELQTSCAAVGPSHIRLREIKAMFIAPGLIVRRQCIMDVEHHSFPPNHARMPFPSAPAYMYDNQRRTRVAVKFEKYIGGSFARNRSRRSNTTRRQYWCVTNLSQLSCEKRL